MGLCPVTQSYQKLWEGSTDPKLLHITYRDKEASLHPRVMHSNDDFSEVLLVREGEAQFFIDGRAWQVKPGDLVFFNTGVAHDQKGEPGKPLVSYSVAVTGFQYADCRPNCLIPDNASPVLPAGELEEPLAQLFQLLYLQMDRNLPGNERTAHHLTQALLVQIREVLRRLPDVEAADREEIPLATRVRAYLDEHFCEDISLQSLADRFNISSYYLAHIFKDQFGYPPLQYILRRRIGLAQTLLITTEQPVGEIGAQVGYLNPSHFNLIFTKNVGISPRKYRLNYLN